VTNEGELSDIVHFAPILGATSLDQLQKKAISIILRTIKYLLDEILMKIGPADFEIIGLQEIIKNFFKKLMQAVDIG